MGYFHRHHFLEHRGSRSGVFKYKVKKAFTVHSAAIAVGEFCFNAFKKNGGGRIIIKAFIHSFYGEKNIYFPAPGINRYRTTIQESKPRGKFGFFGIEICFPRQFSPDSYRVGFSCRLTEHRIPAQQKALTLAAMPNEHLVLIGTT